MTLVKHLSITPAIQDYVTRYGTGQDEVLRWVVEQTDALGHFAIQQIVPEEGTLLTMLARLVGAESAVEVGTFTGYSSLCLARGLSPTGRLLCCDDNEDWTKIAQEAWRRAGVAERIELRLGSAVETLRRLPGAATIDLSFIDADLRNHAEYYEQLVTRARPGGLVVIDNTLIRGRVVDAADEDARAVHEFNEFLARDDRVDVVLLPFHDGLTLARRRG
jgi:caffeoyl-CoA O-methyltransferase